MEGHPKEGSGDAGGTAPVEREAVFLDGVATGEPRATREANRAHAEVEGLLADPATEVVVVPPVGRLVVRLLSREVNHHDLPTPPQGLHRAVNGSNTEPRYLDAGPLVDLGYGQRPLSLPDRNEDGIPLLRLTHDAHAGNIPYKLISTLASARSIRAHLCCIKACLAPSNERILPQRSLRVRLR